MWLEPQFLGSCPLPVFKVAHSSLAGTALQRLPCNGLQHFIYIGTGIFENISLMFPRWKESRFDCFSSETVLLGCCFRITREVKIPSLRTDCLCDQELPEVILWQIHRAATLLLVICLLSKTLSEAPREQKKL